MFAMETENVKPKETQNKYSAAQVNLVKNLEPIDVMIELKYIKCMVGLILYAIVLEHCGKEMPSSFLGSLGVVCCGLLSVLPLFKSLVAAAEGSTLMDLKKEMEAGCTLLEKATEQNVAC